MANKILNTRISLANDTVENLSLSSKVWLKGEAILAWKPDGTIHSLRIGNGLDIWNDLPNFSSSDSGSGGVYTVEQEDTKDIDTAVETLGLANPKDGTIVIITTDASSSTANCMGYIYVDKDGDHAWHAFAGNVNSSNVIIDKSFTAAGNYTQVGNISKTQSGTAALSWEGKSLNDIFTLIFSKELQPSKTEPSVSLTFSQAGSYEVGTTINPSWSATLNAGSYTYGPATGVAATAWAISDTDSNSDTTASGTFPSFVVDDTTNYKITAEATYNEGVVAKTNLGNASNPVVQIAAGTKSKVSGAVTGYRSFFYGAVANTDPITSNMIRGLTNGGAYNGVKNVSINPISGGKRYIVAVPSSSTRAGLTSATLPNSLGANVTAQYIKTASGVMVDDKRGNNNNPVAYDIWVYSPASIASNEIHDLVLS